MFKTKNENEKLKVGIHELEEILCPCEQHDYIEAGKKLQTYYIGGVIECWHTVKYVCRKYKKVLYKDDRL